MKLSKIIGMGTFCLAGGVFAAAAASDFTISENRQLDADLDLRGQGKAVIAEGATVDLNGHRMFVSGLAGCGTITCSKTFFDPKAKVPSVIDGAVFWLDAADASTLTLGADRTVKSWRSKVGVARGQADAQERVPPKGGAASGGLRSCATASAVGRPVYDTATYGFPTVDLGGNGSGNDFRYPRFTKLRTVFWVIRLSPCGFAAPLLGDVDNGNGTHSFAPGGGGQYGSKQYGNFAIVWNGRSPIADYSTAVVPSDSFQVISATMAVDSASDSLSNDRDLEGRNGGRQISELIAFDRLLSNEERSVVTEYLIAKWQAPSELHVEVPAGKAETNSSVKLSGNVRLVKDGAGTFESAKAGQSYTGGTQVNAGTARSRIAKGTFLAWGAERSRITVAPGAAFDCNGAPEFCYYGFELGGGGRAGARPSQVGALLDKGKSLVQDWGVDFTLEAPGEGKDATELIQHALDACFVMGGGKVTLGKGVYETGGLRVRSRTTFLLKSGAELRGPRDCARYRILARDTVEAARQRDLAYPGASMANYPGGYDVKFKRACRIYGAHWSDAFIRVYDAHDVQVLGEPGSVIDGRNSYDPEGEEGYRGVHGFSLHYATNCVFRGYTLKNAGNWGHNVWECGNLDFDHVTVLGGHNGVQFYCSDYVKIRNCHFDTGDDPIAGFDNHHVRVKNCRLLTWCSAFRIGGYDYLIEDVVCSNSTNYFFRGWLSPAQRKAGAMLDKPKAKTALSVFTNFCDPTLYARRPADEIVFRNVKCEGFGKFMHLNMSGTEVWQRGTPLKHVSFENVEAKGMWQPSCAYADRDLNTSMSFKNCRFTFDQAPAAFFLGANLEALEFDGVKVENCQPVLLQTWTRDRPVKKFEQVEGMPPEVVDQAGPFQVRGI